MPLPMFDPAFHLAGSSGVVSPWRRYLDNNRRPSATEGEEPTTLRFTQSHKCISAGEEYDDDQLLCRLRQGRGRQSQDVQIVYAGQIL